MNTEKIIDAAESILSEGPQVDKFCVLTHSFIPGYYVRQIFMPAFTEYGQTVMTTKIHRTMHSFHVSKGEVHVFLNGSVEIIKAPYWGLTRPGTRRILAIVSDTVWTTFHANEDGCQDLKELERRLIIPHDNPYLSEEIKTKNYLNQKEDLCLRTQ